MSKLEPKVKPKIGLLPTGHKIYWSQFPGLKERGMKMYAGLLDKLAEIGEVVDPGLVDTYEGALEAGKKLAESEIDILLIFPLRGLVLLGEIFVKLKANCYSLMFSPFQFPLLSSGINICIYYTKDHCQ